MMPFPTLETTPKVSQSKSIPVTRIASIDIVRALTMVLMIFVNDFWSLKGVPLWMEHVKAGVDGIGLSDVVFPAFLFIVVYVAFLMSYTWETLTLTTIAFFLTLPFSYKAWRRFEAADAAAAVSAEKDGSEAVS